MATKDDKKMVLEAQELLLDWDKVSDDKKREFFAAILALLLEGLPSTWTR